MTEPAAGSAAAWAEEARQEAAKEEAADAPAVVTSALPDLSFPFTASEDLIELRAALREVYLLPLLNLIVILTLTLTL